MSKNNKDIRIASAMNRITNIFATPEERIKLLRRGLSGKQIEGMYIDVNSILVLGTDWQDGHETGHFSSFFDRITPSIPSILCRHVSSPASHLSEEA